MTPRARRPVLLAAAIVTVVACGSRTGLLVPLPADEGGVDAAPDVVEEPAPEAGVDAPPDVPGVDAPPDVTIQDARPEHEADAFEEDALPPIDVSPPVDVFTDCPDAGSTLVYVISSGNDLMSYYPPTSTFRTIGRIVCPDSTSPFSMAVDSTGVAYVEFQSGRIYHVSTLTAACSPTPFGTSDPRFATFGMGFSSNYPLAGETLYVAGDTAASELGTIDTTSYRLSAVAQLTPAVNQPELTGTGGGDLFGFYTSGSGTAIGQIDKPSGRVVAESPLPGVPRGSGWAFAFWGGDFYTFTAPAGVTVVTRFRPSDGSIVQVATTPGQVIVGAGVSTCAPQQ